jgi:MinD-like ATPase involved in chromosome partitioning or flagellar assembly
MTNHVALFASTESDHIESPLTEVEPSWGEQSESTVTAAAVEGLAVRYPEHAAAIRENQRLAAAITAAHSATGFDADEIVNRVGDRELVTAQRPIDVLVSRCLVVIREHANSGEPFEAKAAAAESTEPQPTDASAAENVVTEPAPAPPPVVAEEVQTHESTAPRSRFGRSVRPTSGPTTRVDVTADLASQTLDGNRYVAVLGAVGGAGATTATVLLGHILAGSRTDQVVAMEVLPHGGSLAFRAGSDSPGSIRSLVAASESVHGCAELANHVDRLPTRLGIAKSRVDEPPLSPDEYRQALVLLARYYHVIVTDVGTGSSADTLGPALGLADLVVIVTNPTANGLRRASLAIDLAQSHGVDPERTILLVNGVHRKSPTSVDDFMATAGSRCAAIMWLPWDQHLAVGDAVALQSVHRSTVDAATRVAAAAVRSMASATN